MAYQLDIKEKEFDIFLSYNRGIIEQIEILYQKLTDLNYKVWMDDHETHARGNLMDQLTIGLNNSKCAICFITKRYSESKNCVLELTYMHENDIPFIIVMVEDIKPKDLGAVGLLITPKTRLNFYKQDHDFGNIWSNERFSRLTETIQYFIDKYEQEKNFAKINNSRSTINSFTSFEVGTRKFIFLIRQLNFVYFRRFLKKYQKITH